MKLTLQQFERIVLKLANQVPTRYWKHWNYPVEDPWMMAAEIDCVRFEADGRRLLEELKASGIHRDRRFGITTRFICERDTEVDGLKHAEIKEH